MLLSLLHETIHKVRTKEDLQKLLDLGGSTGLEATSASTVKAIDTKVLLRDIKTAGTLNFKLDSSEELLFKVTIEHCNVRTLKGFFPKSKMLVVALNNLKALTTLDWLADVNTTTVNISGCEKLTALPNLERASDGYHIGVSGCPSMSYQEHTGLSYLKIDGDSPKFSFKDFISTGLKELTLTQCLQPNGFHKLPYLVMIPKTCHLSLDEAFREDTPALKALIQEAVEVQQRGGTKADVYKLQQDLINMDLDNLADI